MTFVSWQFIVFFILVTFHYYLIPFKWRWLLLLIAGCVFYISFIPVYILLLFLLIIIDYIAGLYIQKTNLESKKKLYLIISILSTVSVLFVFKYFNFFVGNFENVLNFFHWNYPIKLLKFVLPVGLSFHTFQSLAYVIEVYRGRQKAETHFGIYALYVMFYPQLMAGPIERSYNMLHQFHEEHKFEYESVVRGLRLMLWGAFQKVVIADRAAIVVNIVYEKPDNYSGPILILATTLFAFQIFCDFAGYSNIAIGAARVMGFDLMKNFDRPYQSKSIQEFWTRWHISLSTWFRDYVYIPLGGNRVSKLRYGINIMIAFLVSGLWHGAGWTFVIWGGLHGFYLLIFNWADSFNKRFLKMGVKSSNWFDNFIQTFITFSLVSFAWIFFRARDLDQALYIVTHLFSNLNDSLRLFSYLSPSFIKVLFVEREKILGLTLNNWIVMMLSILVMYYIHKLQNTKSIHQFMEEKSLIFRWVIYYVLVLVIFYYAAQGQEHFIYFQF
ncbi:MAG: hypothetical protein ACD_26C00034G0039 [uncultured bacterium]|nr:MAG: hypothetical protein ACD_26C00034G0039 [uncultured bacterium]